MGLGRVKFGSRENFTMHSLGQILWRHHHPCTGEVTFAEFLPAYEKARNIFNKILDRFSRICFEGILPHPSKWREAFVINFKRVQELLSFQFNIRICIQISCGSE